MGARKLLPFDLRSIRRPVPASVRPKMKRVGVSAPSYRVLSDDEIAEQRRQNKVNAEEVIAVARAAGTRGPHLRMIWLEAERLRQWLRFFADHDQIRAKNLPLPSEAGSFGKLVSRGHVGYDRHADAYTITDAGRRALAERRPAK